MSYYEDEDSSQYVSIARAICILVGESGMAMESTTVERSELILPGPAEAVAGLLDAQQLDGNPDEAGLPLLWHWFYLLDRPPQSSLGPDGHPQIGIPSPPKSDSQRLFAGGRVWQYEPLRMNSDATRRTRLLSRKEKSGRSGLLTIMTVRHEISQLGKVVIHDEQDIVYRDRRDRAWANTDMAPAETDTHPRGAWLVDVDPVLLFRFSALTYNSHRIHYDCDFARKIEGYPGIVVHGTLQALFMSEHARRRGESLRRCRFEYRLTEPLFQGQGMVVTSESREDGVGVSVHDLSGRKTAVGHLAPHV
jgi:3-methylfumaryl-CoA hydratase